MGNGTGLDILALLFRDFGPLFRRISECIGFWFAVQSLLYRFVECSEVVESARKRQSEATRETKALCQHLGILATGIW